jgi:hypothetical protein
MEFNLLSWWHRKRIQATVQLSGRPMQFHHVSNPYHADTSITTIAAMAPTAASGRRVMCGRRGPSWRRAEAVVRARDGE